ncbi:hypothetical protein GGX14DRAFT_584003 [Mycena pura]|uniref:Uncharacterized protein n=1 Tax=Mycena pura TaxID=153505 RepID=A0AAD6YW96_9AGAR|nr:hypothetical protein GGX14DRAFT_584003 [Mycena pura]
MTLLSKLFRKLFVRTSGGVFLDGLPADVLGLVFEILCDLDDAQQPYGHEVHSGTCLIPLSETCRNMRAVTMPWIFREVYNWRWDGTDVWPDTLWCLFRSLSTVHIRDHSVRRPSRLLLTPQMYRALPKMQELTKVTLRLQAAIPIELLSALSSVGSLSVLEIHQVRFDGPSSPKDLTFPSLSSLSIGICGFRGVDRVPDIDNSRERDNIVTFLRNVSAHLTKLSISGDLLSSQFCELLWCNLQQFIVSEHAPLPFIPVANLVARMPELRSLAILFTARAPDRFPVPITVGASDGDSLEDFTPHLTSVSLANVACDEPIFGQLPRALESLHLMPMWDPVARDIQISISQGDFRFRGEKEAAAALDNISHLDQLTDLTFTPFDCPPSSNLIRKIARNFPMLQCLHLGYSILINIELYLVEFPHQHYFEALRLIRRLRHLKLSFDILWDSLDRAPPAHGAYLLMQELPDLQRVSYSWRHMHSTAPHRWYTWDRSLLLHPAPPRLPEAVEYERERI